MLSLDGLPSPVKLRDDLKIAEEKFDINSYLHKSEAFKYIGDLPGVEDIIKTINSLIGEISGFVNMLLDILTKLLEWLNIFDMIKSLDDLMSFLFSLFNDNMFGFGFTLDVRNEIMNSFKAGCINLNNTFKFNGLENYALLSLLIALGCSGTDNAYSTTYNLFMNNEKLKNSKTELSYLYTEYNTITDIVEKNNIMSKIKDLESVISSKENAINALFTTATPSIFNVLSKNNADIGKVINLTNDIGTTPIASIIGGTSSGMSDVVLNALNASSSSTQTSTNYKYINNVYEQSGFNKNYSYSGATPNTNTINTFLDTLSVMDNGFYNNKTKNNAVLSSIVTATKASTEITTLAPEIFAPSDFLLF